jgi:general secretion pathway protein K
MQKRFTTGLPRSRSAGFALIATIWALGLITLLGTAAILGARYRATESSAISAAARVALAAEGAVNLALGLLLQQPQAFHAIVEKFPLHCALPGGETAFITIEDEAGKIDLNAARPQLLALLFSRLSESADDGVRIADQIVQFRQGSMKASAARAGDLSSASNPLQALPTQQAGASAGGFVSILQLEQTADMPPSLFRAALPFLTVRSGRPDVSPEAASPRLRRLLNLPGPAAPAPRAGGLNFTIRADVATAEGARFIREATVSFGNGVRPFEIHEWRRGDIDPRLEPAHRLTTSMQNCLRNE